MIALLFAIALSTAAPDVSPEQRLARLTS